MNQIVVWYDGSENARRALEKVIEFARYGAKVTVVSAVHIPVLVGYPGAKEHSSEAAQANSALHEASALLVQFGVEAELVEGPGTPEAVIVDEARQRDADLIVVGTRGLNVVKRLVLGSVSTKLVHDAPCSVLAVR